MAQRIDRTHDETEQNEGQRAAGAADDRRAELEDPDYQRKTLNPEEMRYTLRLQRQRQVEREVRGETLTVVEDYVHERPVRIRIALTPHDVQKRGLIDLIESHYRLVGAEIAKLFDDPDPNLYTYFVQRPKDLEVALCMPRPRKIARTVLAEMAYPDPDGSSEEDARRPITFDEIAEGMAAPDLLAFSATLIVRFVEMVAREKKSTAPTPSGKPRSTKHSSPRTGGRRTTSTSA